MFVEAGKVGNDRASTTILECMKKHFIRKGNVAMNRKLLTDRQEQFVTYKNL